MLFSTHVMEHAERLCDQIILIAKGRKIFDGTVDAALATVARMVILEADADQDLGALCGHLGDVREIDGAEDGLKRWQVTLAQGADAQDLLRTCVDAQIRLARFEPVRPHLHDAFVRLVENGGED